ncbi:hypothetical protein C4S77_09610 [Apibacter adventoris]|uniref:Uncharacterized protein n=2 Tax=Apibacter adventoris TaxID=1679466 RepID=A0A2S8A8L5_9FLAO|nr:hypothetical protein C4S77_09610 [Apibacter adventoris]
MKKLEERVTYIESQRKRFEYEPQYQIKIETQFAYRIRLNDMPVNTYLGNWGGSVKLNLNTEILQSGIQNLNIEIYPEYSDINTQKEFLDPKGYFKLQITQTAWRKDGGGLEEPKTILEYELPKEDKQTGWTIDYAKLKSFTDSLSFEATVPYHLQGWTNGEVFKEEDSLQLKAQVISFYKNIGEAMKNKNMEFLNKEYLKADIENAQAFYFSKEEIKNYLVDLEKSINAENFKVLPIEDCVLKYYGNHRVLSLEALKGIDRGESSLITTYTKDGAERSIYHSLLLYRPKGSSQFQIIR